jgi:hypothetical protein
MTQAHTGNDAAIREQAYLLWEQEGRPDGREMEFWTRAQVKVAESEQLQHLTKAPPKPAKTADPESTPKAAASKVKASPAKAVKAKADGKAKPKKK